MALSRGMVAFFLLLLVAAEIGTIDAKSMIGKETVNTLMKGKEEKEEEEEEKESYCLSQSQQFKGFCFSSDNCAEVCKKESFPGGKCKLENAVRKCFCKKPC